ASGATRPSPGESAPKSPMTAKREVPGAGFGSGSRTGAVADAEARGAALEDAGVFGAGARSDAGSDAARLQAARTTRSAVASALLKSPLLGVREKIAERSELRGLGDARAVFLVSGL